MEYLVEIIGVVLTIISSYVGFLVKSISDKVDTLCVQMAQIDGTTKEMKVWEDMHEKHDEERFTRLDKHILQL